MFIDLDNPTATTHKITRFPDTQPHINIPALADHPTEPIDVRCSITSPEKLLLLLQTANAIERHAATKGTLKIPYLMAARYDRLMLPGDSLDIEVIANLINLAGFRQVHLFDAHSDVAPALIKAAHNTPNECVVKAIQGNDLVLIIPDAGAAKKAATYQKWNPNITTTVDCRKSRNLATGRLTLEVLTPDLCKNRNCLIIDDICDGGATFLAIAQQIQPAHLTLAISHGIFSKGLTPFANTFHRILTTTSFPTSADLSNPPQGLEIQLIPHPL